MPGDDLDDDFAPDTLSDAPDSASDVGHVHLEGEEDEFDLDISTDRNHLPLSVHGSKRVDPATDNPEITSTVAEKKRKRRKKEKERKAKKLKLTVPDFPGASSLAGRPPSQLSTILAQCQARAFSTLSKVELDDLAVPESRITDTTTWKGERTLETLSEFIRQIVPTLATRISQKPKNNGTPTAFVIASNALRVADLTRALRPLNGEKGGEITKLFSRHFKLSEHIEHLKSTKVGVAVGTPGRIGKLLSSEGDGALSLKALTHILLDVTFQDAKNRSIIDIPETRDELFKGILADPAVLKAIKSEKVTIILF